MEQNTYAPFSSGWLDLQSDDIDWTDDELEYDLDELSYTESKPIAETEGQDQSHSTSPSERDSTYDDLDQLSYTETKPIAETESQAQSHLTSPIKYDLFEEDQEPIYLSDYLTDETFPLHTSETAKVRIVEQISIDEPLARPFPLPKALKDDLLHAFYELNKHWIRMADTGAHLDIEGYIRLHDQPMQQILRNFFARVKPRMITATEFLRNFDECCEKALETMYRLHADAVKQAVEPPLFVVFPGFNFLKSNLWLSLCFYDNYIRVRGDKPALRLVFDVDLRPHMSSSNVYWIQVDDCMYSGTQVLSQLKLGVQNIIICPFISRHARDRLSLYNELKIQVFDTDQIPHVTNSVKNVYITPIKGETITLKEHFELHDNLSLWVFQHKIADDVSIPVKFFTGTPCVMLRGQLRIVDDANPEAETINVFRVPNVHCRAIIQPCHTFCTDRSCYDSYYGDQTVLVTQEIFHVLKNLWHILPEKTYRIIE